MYRIRITPADVGRRVSVRRRLVDGRDGLGDVVGDLIGWTSGVLTVRTRGPQDVTVAEEHLVAGRVIPPAPRRAGSA
ncbi:MAG TPA: hypothetical protein VNA12_08750 [Mycobacteriales bacterium]|nr:hypothetical protein [Mycobacteriales bacterium]